MRAYIRQTDVTSLFQRVAGAMCALMQFCPVRAALGAGFRVARRVTSRLPAARVRYYLSFYSVPTNHAYSFLWMTFSRTSIQSFHCCDYYTPID
jgi:hypothetical protein